VTTTLAAPPTIRWPYRCTACDRTWCVFALRGLEVAIKGCPFCGLLRFERGSGEVLAMRELRGGAR